MPYDIPVESHLIILGAMKCGTTSLYGRLVSHPQICPASIKEPEFFSEHQQHGVKPEKYDDLWDFDPAVHKYALEASTGYTKYPSEPNVAERIYNSGIRPKFLYLVRDPFERIESHYNFLKLNDSWRNQLTDPYLIEISKYSLQIKQYLKYFSKESLLVLEFDELKSNPNGLLEKVFSFLELSEVDSSRQLETKNKTELMSRPEKFAQRFKLERLYPFIPKGIKNHVKKILRRSFPHEKDSLSTQQRELIHAELSEEMLELQQQYGIDVSKWGFSP